MGSEKLSKSTNNPMCRFYVNNKNSNLLIFIILLGKVWNSEKTKNIPF